MNQEKKRALVIDFFKRNFERPPFEEEVESLLRIISRTNSALKEKGYKDKFKDILNGFQRGIDRRKVKFNDINPGATFDEYRKFLDDVAEEFRTSPSATQKIDAFVRSVPIKKSTFKLRFTLVMIAIIIAMAILIIFINYSWDRFYVKQQILKSK